MKSIILCGLPGCGKTTVGALLSELLSIPLINVDSVIEETYLEKNGEHFTCRQIFSQKGVGFFRELEKQVIASLVKKVKMPSLVSLGGGAFEHPENVKNLKTLGLFVYLKADFQTSYDRISRDINHYPAYLDPVDPLTSFKRLAQKRIPIYHDSADLEIETDSLSLQQVAIKVLEVLEKRS